MTKYVNFYHFSLLNYQINQLFSSSFCLSAFLALSPDLLSLVTDDVVDCAAFEQLLHVGFSTPSFEQVSSTFKT